MTNGDPWSILGIARTTDETLIRRAYAKALKTANPEEDASAFASVRAAYEFALAHARRGAAPVAGNPTPPQRADVQAPVAANPRPAPTATVEQVPPPAGLPDDTRQLAEAFKRLHVAANTPGSTPQVLAGLLDDCLRMPALERMQTRLEFESSLAGWLWAHRNRPGVPIGHAIDRLKWRSATRVREPPQITAILRYADFLLWMESPDFQLRQVFRALSTRPRPPWLWWNIFAYRIDREVREAMTRLDRVGGSLPAGWNAEAVAWWRKHLSRPQPSTSLMRFTGLLVVVGLVVAMVTGTDDSSWERLVQLPLLGLVAGTGLTAGWYFAVDLPLSRRRVGARRVPRWQVFGWAPAALATCLLAGCLPDNVFSIALASVLALLATGWCYWASRVTSRDGAIGLTGQRLLAHIVLNVPLAVWWSLMSSRVELQPTIAMLAATACCALDVMIGQRLLSAWRSQHDRWLATYRAPIGLFGASLLSLGMLATLSATPQGVRLTTMAIVATVMAERALAIEVLGGAQLKIRYYVTTLPFALLAPGLVAGETRAQVIFQGLGTALLLAVAVGAALCCHALWRERTARSPRGR